jgi:2-hydroxychromene-2-carboxylate isomerase
MAASHIDFWFTMGRTYSYLSVMRLVQLERLTGIRFRWGIVPAAVELGKEALPALSR